MKFNLEKALHGVAVIHNVSGVKSHVIGKSYNCTDCFILENETGTFQTVHLRELQQEYEMDDPKEVTLTLPCPLFEPQEGMVAITDNGGGFVVADIGYRKSNHNIWMSISFNEKMLRSGRCFATKEKAQAWINALEWNRA